jgi:hypothetical protein
MTDHEAHDRPPVGIDMARLRPYLHDALLQQKDKPTALAIARKLDRGEWRAVTDFEVVGDDLDEVDLHSLHFRVEVLVSDGWATLARIHWSNLGLEWADVQLFWDQAVRQHREGTFPGGDQDPDRRGGE